MALAMSRPWKHPKTGVYWLRKRVPADLAPILGKAEVTRTLDTRDPGEAKRRHAEALLRLEAQWANLRAGPRIITEREAHELARPVYDHWLKAFRDNPSQQTLWRTDIAEKLWQSLTAIDPVAMRVRLVEEDLEHAAARIKMQKCCEQQAERLLTAHGLRPDERNREILARAVGAAMQRACLVLARAAQGDFSELTAALNGQAETSARPNGNVAPEPPVSFDELVARWAAEKRPAGKTLYEWKRVVR